MSDSNSDAWIHTTTPTAEVDTALALIAAFKQTVEMLRPYHLRKVRDDMCSEWSETPTDCSLGKPIVDQLEHRLLTPLYLASDRDSEKGDDENDHIPNENAFIKKHKPTVLKSHIAELSRGLTSLNKGEIDTCQSMLKQLNWESLGKWVDAHKKWQSSSIVPETIEGQPEELDQSTAESTALANSNGGQSSESGLLY